MAAHIAAGLDTAPAWRWQHGQDRARDTMTRAPHAIESGLEVLLAAAKSRMGDGERGGFGNAEANAAERFRDNYLLGIEGVRDTERTLGHCDPGTLHIVQLARCRAVTSHRAIADVIGPGFTGLLVAFLVEDLSCAAMSRRYHLDASDGGKRMATRMETLLIMLAGLYAALDRKRGDGPRARRAALRAAAAGEWD